MAVACGIVLFLLLAIVAVGASGVLIERDYEEPEALEVSDIPLMTDEEKAHARETGIASYQMGGRVYNDESLPPEYYEEEEWTE